MLEQGRTIVLCLAEAALLFSRLARRVFSLRGFGSLRDPLSPAQQILNADRPLAYVV